MPIIFLTGFGDEELAVKAMQSGAANYFSKNRLEAERIVKAIRHAIHQHKSMQTIEDFLF